MACFHHLKGWSTITVNAAEDLLWPVEEASACASWTTRNKGCGKTKQDLTAATATWTSTTSMTRPVCRSALGASTLLIYFSRRFKDQHSQEETGKIWGLTTGRHLLFSLLRADCTQCKEHRRADRYDSNSLRSGKIRGTRWREKMKR